MKNPQTFNFFVRVTNYALFSVLSLLHLTTAQIRPPNLSPDNLPDTAFTCEDKVTGGYYADVEADCQLFHVCVQVSEYEVSEHEHCANIARIFLQNLSIQQEMHAHNV